MRPRIPIFIALLIFALGISFLLIWSVSLYFIVEQQNQSVGPEVLDFQAIWGRQLLPVLLSVLTPLLVVYFLLYRWLLKPLQRLANKIARLSCGRFEISVRRPAPVTIGLEKLHRETSSINRIIKDGSLTGLNNRDIFEDRLTQAVSEGKRSGRKYALVLVQLENLEGVYQQHDQVMVDAILKKFAQRLSEGLRGSDNVSHFDKGQFALLLEIQDQDQLVGLVEKIYLKLAKRYHVLGHHKNISTVLGISQYPQQAATAKQLFQYASSALSQAQSKAWPIVFYEDENKTDISGFTLIQALRKALDNDEFKLVFQPVIEVKGHRTVYLEALLRWKDPKMHNVSIARTIHLAEKNQLIQPLTNWIVLTVCRLLNQLQIDDLVIGINLSMIDLHDRYLPRRIEKAMKKYKIKPGKIVIEITEGQIMQEPDEVAEILSHLGMMGLSLSIDDFGTGQASLTYLKKLPVEKLKIDQSFICDMAKNADDRLIVKATIELAHTLDLKVIAEGVESAEVNDLLDEMNCDYVQGYYISRPLEAEQVPQWFTQLGKED
jgi:diguanylate cyclase (GGDEF)-like protein